MHKKSCEFSAKIKSCEFSAGLTQPVYVVTKNFERIGHNLTPSEFSM